MNNVLNISRQPIFDEKIIKKEYHNYSPFTTSYQNSDEIRISIQHQDLYLLPSESFLYIEGSLTKSDGLKLGKDKDKDELSILNNNCMTFLFDEIRYELNGIEIDRTRNLGYTSTLKNYVSLNEEQSNKLYNAGWSPKSNIIIADGLFNYCIPLKMLLGFAEDYKKIIMNARHDLILIRARSDNNVIKSSAVDFKLGIHKLFWRMPHLSVSDVERLNLLKFLNSGKMINMSFRSWDMHEYPMLPTASNHHIWTVKTSSQLEKPRFILFALQTNKNDVKEKDNSSFDHCNLTDVKVYLNSEMYPYDDLNIKYDRNRYALLYEMYSNFQQSYYGLHSQPLLSWHDFKNIAPIVVIDCSHQNETIKSGPVDIKIEFKSSSNFPEKTSAFCLLLHDRIVEYNPLTNEVRKLI